MATLIRKKTLMQKLDDLVKSEFSTLFRYLVFSNTFGINANFLHLKTDLKPTQKWCIFAHLIDLSSFFTVDNEIMTTIIKYMFRYYYIYTGASVGIQL